MMNVWSQSISVKTSSAAGSCAKWVSIRLSVVSRFPVSALFFERAEQMEYG